MSDWDKMSAAKQQAAQYAVHVDNYLRAHGKTVITMTEATTAIFGTSGTGNPRAKLIIEGCAAYGYLVITAKGKRTRYVERSAKPIPQEAMSDAERDAEVKRMKDEVQADIDYIAERTQREIKAAPNAQAASHAFYSGLRDMLGGGRRR